MSKMLDRPVKTFSIGFEEDQYNELPFARTIADKYQTDHHEFIVKPDIINTLPRLIWHYNEPYADSSAVPTFYLSERTRQHVTVALNGDGGDECFAGYNRYLLEKKIRIGSKIPGLLNMAAAEKVIRLLPQGSSRNSISNKLHRFISDIYEKPERRYVRWLCHFDNPLKQELCSSAFRETVKDLDSVNIIEQLFNVADGQAFTDRILNVDVLSYLPDDLLVKVDIASMAHSLEARSPFVDHKMMEFAAALPLDLKLRGIKTKFLLKHAIKDFIPKEIINRKKMGFGVPIDRWIKKDLKTMVYDVLLDKTASERGYFNIPVVKKLLDDHSSGRTNHCYRIWNLLCLELWHRMADTSTQVNCH
jgi:asparagine synthase (glutamine-hydrolysing)